MLNKLTPWKSWDCSTYYLISKTFKRVVKGIFVTRDRPFFFPVKCEMGYFFLVNRDFHTSREAWFCKIIIRETRNKCLIRREPWFSWWLLFRELWKDRFIFREMWSRPPFTTLFQNKAYWDPIVNYSPNSQNNLPLLEISIFSTVSLSLCCVTDEFPLFPVVSSLLMDFRGLNVYII